MPLSHPQLHPPTSALLCCCSQTACSPFPMKCIMTSSITHTDIHSIDSHITHTYIHTDEIDAIAPKRENAQREMERRIVAQMLTCMDDLGNPVTGGSRQRVRLLRSQVDQLLSDVGLGFWGLGHGLHKPTQTGPSYISKLAGGSGQRVKLLRSLRGSSSSHHDAFC